MSGTAQLTNAEGRWVDFVKALDLDSLNLTYALNAGLSFYEAKDYENKEEKVFVETI